jgi:hypothetical protein
MQHHHCYPATLSTQRAIRLRSFQPRLQLPTPDFSRKLQFSAVYQGGVMGLIPPPT